MDFYDVLERVLELLQQHKRVTYRALQHQFGLDEVYLEDLKAEIIEARQLAVDEGGRVLAWIGAVGTAPASAFPSLQVAPQPSALDDSPPHDTPSPTSGSISKDRVRIAAYQVQEMGDLVWAYLGSEPAPLLPRLELCERDHELRQIVPNKYGFTKGMRNSDDPEDVWQLGGPVFFPYLVYPNGGNSGSIRHDYQIGVPIDDTTTWHISYRSYTFPPEVTVPQQECIPYVEVPLQGAKGEYILDYVLGQDMVAWYEQGEITDRTREHLYEGDKVIIAYRQMLKEQLEIVQRGGDPMNVIRDPAEHVPWVPTLEGWPAATIEAATRTGLPWRQRTTSYRFNFHKVSKAGWKYIEDDVDRYCPDRELILKLYEEADRLMHR